MYIFDVVDPALEHIFSVGGGTNWAAQKGESNWDVRWQRCRGDISIIWDVEQGFVPVEMETYCRAVPLHNVDKLSGGRCRPGTRHSEGTSDLIRSTRGWQIPVDQGGLLAALRSSS